MVCVDGMHTIKNRAVNFLRLIMGLRIAKWLTSEFHATVTVTSQYLGEIQKELKRWKLPPECESSRVHKILNDGRTRNKEKAKKGGKFKFSDTLRFVKTFGKECFRANETEGGLSSEVRAVWFEFVDVVRTMMKVALSLAEARCLKEKTFELLKKMENLLPVNELTLMNHKIGHLCEQVLYIPLIFTSTNRIDQ